LLLFPFIVSAKTVSETEKERLKSLGFTEMQILQMDEEEYQKNLNLEGKIVSQDTKYIKTTYIYSGLTTTASIKEGNNLDIQRMLQDKNVILKDIIHEEISEEEFLTSSNQTFYYNTFSVNPDIITTDYKKLTTTISYLSSIKKYRVKNDLIWKKTPSNRSYDISGIKLSDQVQPESGSHYAKMTYNEYNTCKQTNNVINQTFNNVNNWNRSSDRGYAVSVLLPKNSSVYYEWNNYLGKPYPCVVGAAQPWPPLQGNQSFPVEMKDINVYMYFDVLKTGTSKVNTLSAYGSYQHSIKSISLSTSLTFTIGTSSSGNNSVLGGVFEMSPTISESFDKMTGTHAQVTGINW